MARARWILVAALMLAGWAGAGDVASTLDAFEAPGLAEMATAVDAFDLDLGGSRMTLSGSLQELHAGGQRVGFVFSGTGSLAITIRRGAFYETNLTNLKDQEGWTPGASGEYTVAFSGAVVLGRPLPAELFSGDPAPPGAASGMLARHLARWRDSTFEGVEGVLAEVALDAVPGVSLVASLETAGKDALYTLDTATDHVETLGRWKSIQGTSLPWGSTIDRVIRQPAGFDRRTRPVAPLMVTDIDLVLNSPDNELLEETATVTVTASRGNLGLVTFDLTNGRGERPKRWDDRADPFQVTSVRTADGRDLDYSHRCDELLVRLPQPLSAGDSATIVVEAKGRLLKSYQGDSYVVLGNFAYFPQLDPERTNAPFHAVIKVKKPWIAIACGRTVRRWQEGDINCLEAREELPISFPFGVVGKFSGEELERAGYDVTVYSYAAAKKRAAKKLLKNGLAVLDFYSHGMAPYPYGELDVVEIPYFRHFFWQSPAGLVEITSEGFNPMGFGDNDIDSILRRYASIGQNARYAHEIAHQWFGNLVGWARPWDVWLSESMAEYLSYMFQTMGAKDQKAAERQLSSWEQDVKECSALSSIYGARELVGSSAHRRCVVGLLYGKGPYVLHALRHELGDRDFTRVLATFTRAAARSRLKATTEDLIQVVNAVSRRDYRPWFDRYVYGTGIPPIGQ